MVGRVFEWTIVLTELSLVELGAVQRKVLAAHQILSGRKILGQGEREVANTAADKRRPLHGISRLIRQRGLVYLEPVAVALVPPGRAGCLAEVDGQGSRVADILVHLKADLIAGGYGEGLSGLHDVIVDSSIVADNVGRVDRRDGRIAVLCLADVLVGVGDLAIDNQRLEVVVCGSDAREEGNGN